MHKLFFFVCEMIDWVIENLFSLLFIALITVGFAHKMNHSGSILAINVAAMTILTTGIWIPFFKKCARIFSVGIQRALVKTIPFEDKNNRFLDRVWGWKMNHPFLHLLFNFSVAGLQISVLCIAFPRENVLMMRIIFSICGIGWICGLCFSISSGISAIMITWRATLYPNIYTQPNALQMIKDRADTGNIWTNLPQKLKNKFIGFWAGFLMNITYFAFLVVGEEVPITGIKEMLAAEPGTLTAHFSVELFILASSFVFSLVFHLWGYFGPVWIHEKYKIWKRFRMRARRRIVLRIVDALLGQDCTQTVFGYLDLLCFGNDFEE